MEILLEQYDYLSLFVVVFSAWYIFCVPLCTCVSLSLCSSHNNKTLKILSEHIFIVVLLSLRAKLKDDQHLFSKHYTLCFL